MPSSAQLASQFQQAGCFAIGSGGFSGGANASLAVSKNAQTAKARPTWAVDGASEQITILVEFPSNSGGAVLIDGLMAPPSIASSVGYRANLTGPAMEPAIRLGFAGQNAATTPALPDSGIDFRPGTESLPTIVVPAANYLMPNRVAISIDNVDFPGQRLVVSILSNIARGVSPFDDSVAGTKSGFLIDGSTIGGGIIQDDSDDPMRVVSNMGSLAFPSSATQESLAIKMGIIVPTAGMSVISVTPPALYSVQLWPVPLMDFLLAGAVIATPYKAGIGIPSVT